MFQVADVVLINKIDVAEHFDFDLEKAIANIRMRHPGIEIFPVSARTGEGFDRWTDWLRKEVNDWKA